VQPLLGHNEETMSAGEDRYELLAHRLVEGHDQLTACRLAGFSGSSRGSASRTCNTERVRERVRQLMKQVEEQTVAKASWDRNAVIVALQHNAIEARARGDYAASNRAIELLGKDKGLFGSQQQVQSVVEPASGAGERERLVAWLKGAQELLQIETIEELIEELTTAEEPRWAMKSPERNRAVPCQNAP
jgi:hypothetical protein